MGPIWKNYAASFQSFVPWKQFQTLMCCLGDLRCVTWLQDIKHKMRSNFELQSNLWAQVLHFAERVSFGMILHSSIQALRIEQQIVLNHCAALQAMMCGWWTPAVTRLHVSMSRTLTSSLLSGDSQWTSSSWVTSLIRCAMCSRLQGRRRWVADTIRLSYVCLSTPIHRFLINANLQNVCLLRPVGTCVHDHQFKMRCLCRG